MGFDMNYKIKVESNVEEIQDLFIQLGCTYFNHTVSDKNYMLIEDGKAFFYKFKKSFDKSKSKEITLPELRDLVVLKRNDSRDANYIRPRDRKLYFVNSDKTRSYYMMDEEWTLSKWDEDQLQQQLKPIEKKEMKEYLVKDTVTGYYFLTKNHSNFVGAIEVPEWASLATVLESGALKLWDAVSFERCPSGYIIWQRESLNDKLASAEQYRQAEVLPFIDDELHKSREWDLSDYDFAESDAWIESNIEQGSIEQTLAQRQSQYGCFEDVAFVTQGMIELMRKCNYDKMPAPHQMALSMICSKMARIVNGDFNHKDSWHDIGGYAKLVENEIFDDITEMPF